MKPGTHRLRERTESETLEFKAARTSLATLAQAACAMLNQSGEILLWGVDDHGRAQGMEDAGRHAAELTRYLMGRLRPKPLLSVSVRDVDSKRVVAVDIPPGADKPYSVDRRIWVRIGTRTFRADTETSAGLVERSAAQPVRWEREPMPGFSLADYDTEELAVARKEIARGERFGLGLPTGDEEFLRALHLERSGQLANAAVALFARRPRAWAPNLAVRVAFYAPDQAGPVGNDVEFEGPAIRVLRDVIGILQQRTGVSARFAPGRIERQDRPAYPLYALREGLVNAIVHRDYQAIGGSVGVELFPDRLIIRNPGKLPNGWTAKSLLQKQESHPRNPDIARVFYLRTLMEQLGLGIQKVVAARRENGARTPAWRAEQGTVSLTLYRAHEPEVASELGSRQRRFFETAASRGDFTAGDYADAAGVSLRQARRDLAELGQLGLLARFGKGPATIYRRTARSQP
ncbi:MAG: putative DNA binding domain-containing protein [Planctomycetes bacterium]|nr:putative DNA binding domain-containing protein [Planctomycetota bacterium]